MVERIAKVSGPDSGLAFLDPPEVPFSVVVELYACDNAEGEAEWQDCECALRLGEQQRG